MDIEGATALITGLIFNQSCPSHVAWHAPRGLYLRLALPQLTPSALHASGYDAIFAAIAAKPSLHRFPKVIAGYVAAAMASITDVYAGDPRALWADGTAEEIMARLTALRGIGKHKAAQGVLLLSGMGEIAVSTDTLEAYMREHCASFLHNLPQDVDAILRWRADD